MKVPSFILCLLFANGNFANSQTILPSTDVNLMNYYLYTSTVSNVSIQYNNAASLAASGFNPNQPTTILIDGFLSNSTNSQMTQTLKNALLANNYPGNIIIVDWGALSGGTSGLVYTQITATIALALYPVVVLNAPAVGTRLGQFMQFLNVPSASLTIWGHSEGGHIAGDAGTYYYQQENEYIKTIVGLDPAGPLYLYLDINLANSINLSISGPNQLDPSDAAWVAAYHTGRGTSLFGIGIGTGAGFGTTGTAVGDVDIFVNFGNAQPGCTSATGPTAILANAYCDHKYSWQFYASTIASDSSKGCSCQRITLIGLFSSCVCGSSFTCPQPNCSGSLPNAGYGLQYGTSGGLYVNSPNPLS